MDTKRMYCREVDGVRQLICAELQPSGLFKFVAEEEWELRTFEFVPSPRELAFAQALPPGMNRVTFHATEAKK